MKLPSAICGLRCAICKKSPGPAVAGRRACAGGDRESSIANRKTERGVALVITLILLSVTLIMAVAFLAVSRRERGSVVTSTDTATARLAADAALANAEAQIISSALATTNSYNYGLLVSTNYLPPTTGSFLFDQTNLFIAPRAPVFAVTNQQTGAAEFRFYLDLNRNGTFEDSGWIPETNNLGQPTGGTNFEMGDPQWIGVLERPDAPHGPNNKFLSRYAFIAVPAGNALDLNYIHNQALDTSFPAQDEYFRNQGVGSWELNLAAFLADLNTNEWETVAAPYNYQQPAFPNTGFAFQDARSMLMYRYNYNPANPGSYIPPQTLSAVLPNYPNFPPLGGGPVDIYTFPPAMTGTAVPSYNYLLNQPWSGADNTNHFFALASDLFDPAKVENGVTPPGFIERLTAAGNGNGAANPSTYDRYTFYRLLSQLGTDSSPESGKMDLNYDNLNPYRNGILDFNNGVVGVTNFVAWTPLGFFTNAADRLLRVYSTNWFQAGPSNYLAAYYGINYTNYIDPATGFGLTNTLLGTNTIPAFGLTNLPVYVNGRFVYSSAIQRVLQLAANIYDSTTNYVPFGFPFGFPSVFRPNFHKYVLASSTNVFVVGYQDVNSSGPQGSAPVTLPPNAPYDRPVSVESLPLGFTPPNPLKAVSSEAGANVYGVPWIVGAKKGLPNFNAFALQSAFQITRKLELTRKTTTDDPSTYGINQQFNCSISNQIAVQCWNSYSNNYNRPTHIYVSDQIQMQLTNGRDPAIAFSLPLNLVQSLFAPIPVQTFYPGVSGWLGIGGNMNPRSFLTTNFTDTPLPNSTYIFNGPLYVGFYHFSPIPTNNNAPSVPFEVVPGTPPASLPQPHWWLLATNNLQVVMMDDRFSRVIDYVQLRGPITSRDLTAEMLAINNPQAPVAMWNTNLVKSKVLTPFGSYPGSAQTLPAGVEDQLEDSESFLQSLWGVQSSGSVQPQIDGFNRFIGGPTVAQTYGDTNLQIQAPYTPTATVVQNITWDANDPLVHYLAGDLFDSASKTNAPSQTALLSPQTGKRYQPWSKLNSKMLNLGADGFDLAFKDPLMWRSDFWDFPTNALPVVGWLGRVHRGTPWQTVYLKGKNVLKEANGTNIWANWTGNINTNDALNAAPVQDRLLFDVFTTAVNDNATRGQLSVNVAASQNDPLAGLAAWSAVFSGVVALTNTTPDALLITISNAIYSANKSKMSSGVTLPPPYTNTYASFPVNPAGGNGAAAPLGGLVTNINYERAFYTNSASVGGAFKHVGDILSVAALTEQSPFLNWNDVVQQRYGIGDEMYEWLPQQAMSLLRVSAAPRYVIYCYGQTLKPAPNGIVTGGAGFGLVTNYQVVAETATRAVVQFKQVTVTNSLTGIIQTNYTPTIEQFNPLPPD